MSSIEQYLKNNKGHYINPFQVESTLDDAGGFEISVGWPVEFDEPDFKLEIVVTNMTVPEFSKRSGIKTVEQLHFVSMHTLIDLFYKGVAQISCMIDNPDYFYEIRFYKKDGRLYMIDEEEDIDEPVSKPLETPVDFYEYTQDYLNNL